MPKRPMMVQLGVTQILEGQMPHAVHRGIHVNSAGANSFQQAAQLVLIHSN